MTSRRDTGLTMIELMVAVAILAVVVSGVMESFVVQNRAYTVVDQTTEVQQNLRTISFLLERDARATGFMVPESASVCAIDNTNQADTLYLTDPEPIDPAGQSQAGLGASVTLGYAGTPTEQTLNVSSLVLDGQPYFDTNGDGAADSDFRIGGGVILHDPGNPARGTACGIVTDQNAGTGTIRVDFQTSLAGGGGSVELVPAIVYRIDNAGTLTRNGLALASDIDDLQVAFFVDDDDDGQVSNANEYRGSADSTIDYASNAVDHSLVRELRFNLVVRSRTADVDYSEGFFQATENRGAVGGADGFRRRVLTTTVRPRNLGFRGAQPNA